MGVEKKLLTPRPEILEVFPTIAPDIGVTEFAFFGNFFGESIEEDDDIDELCETFLEKLNESNNLVVHGFGKARITLGVGSCEVTNQNSTYINCTVKEALRLSRKLDSNDLPTGDVL